MNLWIIFLTGLTTGGLTCLAMQGGLLASVIANQKDAEHDEQKQKSAAQRAQAAKLTVIDRRDWWPVGMFLVSKLVAHIMLGFLLGWLGSVISLSVGVRLFFQAFTAFFMFATAMNLLDVHPIFRYVAFQPPKFLQKLVRGSSQRRELFAPAMLGLVTIFVPCGVTQAMEVLAINSGSPIQGALIMGVFVLGTSPLFAALGLATAKLSEGWYRKFTQVAAVALVAMAIYGLNGVLVVLDSPVTIQKIWQPVEYFFSDERFEKRSAEVRQGSGPQKVLIRVMNSGYQPRYIKVNRNVPVELTLQSNGTYSCAAAFVFPEFGIDTFLEANDQQTFTFTPTKPGRYTFSCSMGMYTGTLEVL